MNDGFPICISKAISLLTGAAPIFISAEAGNLIRLDEMSIGISPEKHILKEIIIIKETIKNSSKTDFEFDLARTNVEMEGKFYVSTILSIPKELLRLKDVRILDSIEIKGQVSILSDIRIGENYNTLGNIINSSIEKVDNSNSEIYEIIDNLLKTEVLYHIQFEGIIKLNLGDLTKKYLPDITINANINIVNYTEDRFFISIPSFVTSNAGEILKKVIDFLEIHFNKEIEVPDANIFFGVSISKKSTSLIFESEINKNNNFPIKFKLICRYAYEDDKIYYKINDKETQKIDVSFLRHIAHEIKDFFKIAGKMLDLSNTKNPYSKRLKKKYRTSYNK